ncbi:hypothetical protein A0H81_08376 [Grifola frondosa]|uniref:AB hydrolase-1 domain-containing protein n=1 Tax=Grifola frondosa TaxID=5627 RepID=A0A1C7M397_GRIFR|nr:hypothetical protein A0H81_08376 [Grifola frondosa]
MSFTTSTAVFTYPAATKPGLKLVGKRYVPARPAPGGPTLVFTHCTGSHKEVWEPVIGSLFDHDPPSIREAWAFDWQSHGEAGVLNDALLKDDGACGLSVREWAAGLQTALASRDFSGHRLVGIGHSSGATAILLSTISSDAGKGVPYEAIVLVEPSLITRAVFNAHLAERERALKFMHKAITARRDTWGSREEALLDFKTRLPWKIWHPRVLSLLVKHGIKDVSAEDGTAVALACSKIQERTAYAESEPYFVAVEWLGVLDPATPVHCIFGDRYDLVPKYAHDSVLEVRKMASVQTVPRAGHSVVQENPDGVAASMRQSISTMAAASSKL